ncbi:MAG: AlkA N-terminal domain-containing protein [Myxococcota bacterium]
MSGEASLDPERCYRAVCSRDARFDGRFFTGVRTTGIFCRPICPAPTPRAAHCSFGPSAAAAQAAGFRPCLRCRPEAAPGSPAWRGTQASVGRALRLIEQGALDGDGSVEALAARLGIGARHLRRLFERHVGATPQAVARLRRVLFAKKLIDETRLPMTEVAAAAGFASQRRFNACLSEVYGRPPSALRRVARGRTEAKRDQAAGTAVVPLALAYRPPFDWAWLLAFLSVRATPGVEAVEAGRYLRVTRDEDGLGVVVVEHDAARRRLRARLHQPRSRALARRAADLRRLFDLDADAREIDFVLRGAGWLRADLRRHPGTRVPGAWDGFETAVRAVLGQQVSVAAATTLAGRVAARWGEVLPGAHLISPALERAFPTPTSLCEAPLESVGLPRTRAQTIRSLASAVRDDPSLLEPGVDLEADLARWQRLPGIGPWTAAYVAMRVLRHPDALPAGDLALRKGVARDGDEPPPARAVEDALEACRPYRAYAAMRIWASAGERT